MYPIAIAPPCKGSCGRRRILLIAATVFASGLAVSAATAQDLKPNEIPLRSGTVSIGCFEDGVKDLIRRETVAAAAAVAPSGPARVVLQFKEIPSQKELQSLAARGIRVLDFVGNNSYFATIESQGATAACHGGW